MEDSHDLRKYESVMNGWSFVRKIGHGSIGRVYEICKDDRRAALKIISLPDGQEDIRTALSGGIREEDLPRYFDNVMQMFISEYEHMQRLSGSRHIVQYGNHRVIPHEDGIGGDILIRMEILTPLVDYALDYELDEEDVLNMGLDITDALMDCEAANILHRDIKPDNIFVSEKGEFKLGDFGVARIIEETEMNLSHRGTIAYMAPEVYRGEEYGKASDIYSLGLVMYKYLNNGRLPFMPRFPEELVYDDSDKALCRRIRREEPEPPENGTPALKAAVLKAISGNTEERYGSAAEMYADLVKVAAEMGVATDMSDALELSGAGVNTQISNDSFNNYRLGSNRDARAKSNRNAHTHSGSILQPDSDSIFDSDYEDDSDLDEGTGSVIGLVARKNKKACIVGAVVLLLAVVGGCIWAAIPKEIEDVSGLEPETEILIGESIAPEYLIEPDWFKGEPLKFESGNTDVFTVDEEGKITAAGIGEADLVIAAGNKSDRHYYTEKDRIRIIPKVTEISGIEDELTLTDGETHRLRPVLYPEKYKAEPITCDAADAEVAVVNDEGIIAAVAPGETKITISAGGCVKEISLTVKAEPQPVYSTSSGGSGSKSSGNSSKKSSGSKSKSSSDGYIDDMDDEYFD